MMETHDLLGCIYHASCDRMSCCLQKTVHQLHRWIWCVSTLSYGTRIFNISQVKVWSTFDVLQLDEDSPQPVVWSRRRASSGCSPHTCSTSHILLHLETRDGKWGRKGERTKTVGYLHITFFPFHIVRIDESLVVTPFAQLRAFG